MRVLNLHHGEDLVKAVAGGHGEQAAAVGSWLTIPPFPLRQSWVYSFLASYLCKCPRVGGYCNPKCSAKDQQIGIYLILFI
jgi:hypothetical protein